MNVQFFCPCWGFENLSWEDFCRKVDAAGYDGIEYAIPSETPVSLLDEIWDTVTRSGLRIIAQHFDTNEADFIKHAELYENWLEKIKPYPVVKINSQTGKDHFTIEQNKALISVANNFSAQSGNPVLHETHRGKFAYAAHSTKTYLEEMPGLRLTLDVSHWVCVAESYLDDQRDALALAIERTDHIHARVGHTQGPQVPDPRLPAWQPALQKHLAWWDQVVALKKAENTLLTITTEFGPFPYLVNPAVTQWEMNIHMLKLLKSRYA